MFKRFSKTTIMKFSKYSNHLTGRYNLFSLLFKCNAFCKETRDKQMKKLTDFVQTLFKSNLQIFSRAADESTPKRSVSLG